MIDNWDECLSCMFFKTYSMREKQITLFCDRSFVTLCDRVSEQLAAIACNHMDTSFKESFIIKSYKIMPGTLPFS